MYVPVITCLSIFCVIGNWANGERAGVEGKPVASIAECHQVADLALALAGAPPEMRARWFSVECRKVP